MGKIIYQPSGAAKEYAKYAANTHVGCTGRCTYCYNRKGITAKVLGGDKPTLKKCLENEDKAMQIFMKEADQNIVELRKHGLFFNFVSDPFLKETIELNMAAILYCLMRNIPVKTLTKQTWWLEEFLTDFEKWIDENLSRQDCKELLAFGFTLSGHDELEPGCATNEDRIRAMKVLNAEGFKTWASIEPIIDLDSSWKMITAVSDCCDLMKIGMQSGKKYDKESVGAFIGDVVEQADMFPFKIYFKDSILKASGISRYPIGNNEVDSNYSMFTEGNQL